MGKVFSLHWAPCMGKMIGSVYREKNIVGLERAKLLKGKGTGDEILSTSLPENLQENVINNFR